MAWRGLARQGEGANGAMKRLKWARHGGARPGEVWQGMVWQGEGAYGAEKRRETMGAKIYKNGLPYAPDIRRLDDAFPTPEEGQVLRYEQFEEVLNYSRVETRFRTVISSWRRTLWRTRNIDTEAVPSVGIKILEPADRVKIREKDMILKARLLGRTRQRFASAPRERLNVEGQQRYDHVMLYTGRVQQAIDDAKKALPADIAPVKSLPKPKLIKNG